jgi:hypothetical protein
VSNVKPRKGYELESQGNSNGKDFDRALLTPHGQGLLDSEGADLDEVDISGCPYGPNPEVLHVNGAIRVVGEDGAEATVSFDAWKAAVFAFADQVKAFYDASPPRRSWDDPDDDAAYASFWSEWTRRRGA